MSLIDSWATPIVDHNPSDTEKEKDAKQRKTRFTDSAESIWDQSNPEATPLVGATPGATPLFHPGMETPMGMTPSFTGMSGPFTIPALHPSDPRNRIFTDEQLEEILPSDGYEVIEPPENYESYKNISYRRGGVTPMTGFNILGTSSGLDPTVAGSSSVTGVTRPVYSGVPDLPDLRPEDIIHFSSLLHSDDKDGGLTPEQAKEKRVLALLLKVKNGTPIMRKMAMREITHRASYFGPQAMFNQLLPLLMSTSLEDQERHSFVKIIDRVLNKIGIHVRPYVHKILVVIEPLLIDEDFYARAEGREIISNLAKAAGLPVMIATMRPDIDHPDEYVRNTTARALAVVGIALGIQNIIPFIRAVCNSRKSWQARHTGLKIIQQIAINVGCAVLNYLQSLVTIASTGLTHEQQKVRTISALAISALAESAYPYGIECFDSVLRPLWRGTLEHRGKGLAAFLKAIGFIVPLMDAEHANYYTREVMIILVREFSTPDDEMRRIVLQVIRQCVKTDGVEGEYIKEDILPPFFRNLWITRMAADKRNYFELVDTTVAMSKKVGGAVIISRIVDELRDANETYRRMVIDTIYRIVDSHGVNDIDSKLEERLIDGLLYAFQEQSTDDATTVLDGFACVLDSLDIRAKPYLPQISGVIRWRLNTASARARQQAADMIARLANVMRVCSEEQMLGHFALQLYEYLGEEYPDVLGSILGALKNIVSVIGMARMTPPIKDLLPRLTPILKNRHEKVMENCIELVGRIADRGAEFAPPREWNRICFDLLELLKAQKKSIRRATVNTFGYIAKAIGPHDVITTLLNHLRVVERQLRLCSTIAIAIVAETCGPFTVLPAIMNEYKTPDPFVQRGILKTLSFMFEYISETSNDYVHAVTPLLEHALTDRDRVHRQTAIWAVKHLELGLVGLGQEDCLQHLVNFVWPNIFETRPHLIQSFFDCIDALRVIIGSAPLLQLTLQGLWHPARRVRECYWRVYNHVYVGSQSEMIAFYPRAMLTEPDANPENYTNINSVYGRDTVFYNQNYWRTELDLMI